MCKNIESPLGQMLFVTRVTGMRITTDEVVLHKVSVEMLKHAENTKYITVQMFF